MYLSWQEVRLPGDERLVPKVHVNLGITLEADGRLLAACNHYQCVPSRHPLFYTHFSVGLVRFSLELKQWIRYRVDEGLEEDTNKTQCRLQPLPVRPSHHPLFYTHFSSALVRFSPQMQQCSIRCRVDEGLKRH